MEPGLQALFPGFETHRASVPDGVEIAAVVGGSGSPVLLLHGHPQTCVDVDGEPLPCGHFIAEEAPAALLERVLPFLSDQSPITT